MAGKDHQKREGAADLRTRTNDELDTTLLAMRKEQFNLRFQAATGQQEGVGRVRQLRRAVARIKTVQTERQRSIVKSSGV